MALRPSRLMEERLREILTRDQTGVGEGFSAALTGDLARVLGLNQTTCSHQLRLLRAAEIVRARREGKVIYYSLKNRKIEDVMYAGVRFLGL